MKSVSRTHLILSPNRIDVITVLPKKNEEDAVTVMTKEHPGFVVKDKVDTEFLRQCVKEFHLQGSEVGVSLNLPYFFTNIINIPDIKEGGIDGVLKMKIQSEFPLPLDQYFWSYQEVPSEDQNRSFLVMFYHRQILETIEKTLESSGVIPAITEPSLLSQLRYVTEKVTLQTDKLYFMLLFYANVLTGFTYENGIIKNTFSEFVSTPQDINVLLERFVQFTLQKFSIEEIKMDLGGIVVVSDVEVSLQVDLNVITIPKNPAEVLGQGVHNRVLGILSRHDEIALNIANPLKTIFTLRAFSAIRKWTFVFLGCIVLVYAGLAVYTVSLKAKNEALRKEAIDAQGLNVREVQTSAEGILIALQKTGSTQSTTSSIPVERVHFIEESTALFSEIKSIQYTQDSIIFTGSATDKQMKELVAKAKTITSQVTLKKGKKEGTLTPIVLTLKLP
ncbi:MAG: hypothetical protein UU76_C0010G0002 [Parcubacteria group bacterium GW2011_GWC1_41_7]|nr:MAG: hypothetical protein UU76_C0010G0002 [Parcubacteria group bacterium GW2011_GWC1_41_7]